MIVGCGAEAQVILRDGVVIKERVQKSYRHVTLDARLRAQRTRREANIIRKLNAAKIPSPLLQHSCDEQMVVHMSYLEGKKLREVLTLKLAREVGQLVGRLHAIDVVHGDLTTSNFVVSGKMVHIIDFGLSFISKKTEDKAVDLLVLKRAFESAHHERSAKYMGEVFKGYTETYADAGRVFDRLSVVETRGRNKTK